MNQIKELSFDVGIELQTQIDLDQETSYFRENNRLLPSESRIDGQVEQIFQHPSIKDVVLAGLKPAIDNRQMLTPEGYADMLNSVQEKAERLQSDAQEEPVRELLAVLQDELDELSGGLDFFRYQQRILLKS